MDSLRNQTKLIQIRKTKNNDTKSFVEKNNNNNNEIIYTYIFAWRWNESESEGERLDLDVCLDPENVNNETWFSWTSNEHQSAYTMRKISYSLFWYFTLKFLYVPFKYIWRVLFYHKLFCGDGFVPCLACLPACLTAYMAI